VIKIDENLKEFSHFKFETSVFTGILFDENFDFGRTFQFWGTFQFSANILIFEENFDFGQNF